MKSKLMLKSTALILVIFIFCITTFVPVTAASTSQMRNEIEKLEEQSEKLEKDIA